MFNVAISILSGLTSNQVGQGLESLVSDIQSLSTFLNTFVPYSSVDVDNDNHY